MSGIRFTNTYHTNPSEESLIRDPDSVSAFTEVDDALHDDFQDNTSPFSFVADQDDCPEMVTELVKAIRSRELERAVDIVNSVALADQLEMIPHLYKKTTMAPVLKKYMLDFCEHLDTFGWCNTFSQSLRNEMLIM